MPGMPVPVRACVLNDIEIVYNIENLIKFTQTAWKLFFTGTYRT